MKSNDTVGVRELRQNLSVYLRRVAAGQSLRVTERGRIVAALVPLHDEEPVLNRLAKERRLILPQGDLLALGPPKGPPTNKLSKSLAELREERL
jgi:prevent-host-death family protein